MAKKDLSSLDRTIMQPLSRDIDDAFSDGIDCDVKIMGGNSLLLYDTTDTLYNAIYTDGSGNLVIPAETAVTYNDDVALNFGSDSDASIAWISGSAWLYLSTAVDATDLIIGNGTLSWDIVWYGSSTGSLVTFGSATDDVTFNGVDLSLEDSDHLYLGDSNDVDIRWDGTDLDILPSTDAYGMVLGDNTHGWTITVYGGSTSQSMVFTGGATNTLVFDDIDVYVGDNDSIYIGDSSDVQIRWDATDLDILGIADDQVIKIGNGTNSFDVWIYGESANDNVIFDASGKTLKLDGIDLYLEDDDYLIFGDSSDVTMRWINTGGFEVRPAADKADFIFGTTDLAWDIIWYGDATTNVVTFGAAANAVTFDAVDLLLGDDDILGFGDTTAPGDVYMRWDNTDFDILPAVDGTIMQFGNGTLDFDIIINLGAASVTFNEGAATVTLDAADLALGDSDHLYLGDSSDVDIYFNGANDLMILPGNDLDNIYLGSTAGDKSWDIYWTGAGAANTVQFGVAANTVTFAAVDITMSDTARINFSTTGNYIYASTGSQLDIVGSTTLALSGAVTTDGIVTLGSYLKVYGTTGSGAVETELWYDNTSNKLMFYNGTAVETITSST